ncbi:MAG: hypothetical protein IPM46_11370 [Flavobacteriales bacterium]|nr:hypothetical protein [Flavobacteriales bacterium]
MLTVSCQENWNRMSPVEGGRFCGKCQHAVVDFTGWSREAVLAYKRAHPDACGRYLPEHLEPQLIPLADLLKPKRGVLAAGLLLGSVQVMAQVDAPPPTEQIAPAGIEPAALDQVQPVLLPTDKPDGVNGTCPVPEEEPKWHHNRRPARKLYVSKRFPFVHVRRRFVMGF